MAMGRNSGLTCHGILLCVCVVCGLICEGQGVLVYPGLILHDQDVPGCVWHFRGLVMVDEGGCRSSLA